ncbi:MAG: hypothetical protein KDA37_17645 [Planctomycetales bacterium]|nr:hypothetical protein [Planctomycetales bacterium]
MIAVTSSMVLTLFNMLSLQKAETSARAKLLLADSLADAAVEHALAKLIAQRDYEGSETIALDKSRIYRLQVARDDKQGLLFVTGEAVVQGAAGEQPTQRSLSRTFTLEQLDKRRAAVGLR